MSAIFPRFRFFILVYVVDNSFSRADVVVFFGGGRGGRRRIVVDADPLDARPVSSFLYSSTAVMNFDSENRRPDRENNAYWENFLLRMEAENYLDESFYRLRFGDVKQENDELRYILAWESSPISTILQLLGDSWRPLNLRAASDEEVSAALVDLAERLRRLHQEIFRADHLSDRRLYALIVKRVLPDKQKRLPSPPCSAVWTFETFTEDQELDETDLTVWLTYYATPEERRLWAKENNAVPPPRQTPLYARRFPSLNGGCDSLNDRR